MTPMRDTLPMHREKHPAERKEITTHSLHAQVPKVVQTILQSWQEGDCYQHISVEAIPSKEQIIQIVEQTQRILFPGYFTPGRLHPSNLEFAIGTETAELYDRLTEQIYKAVRHDCSRNNRPCINCEVISHELALEYLKKLPEITKILATDIRAALKGDPAAGSADEVIFCYPGLLAVVVHRIANALYLLDVPIIPRIMSEYAHSLTGIDIHPGATIGEGFFIDHGTGVVIGETTIIGDNVRIYQGVTLGALSLGRDAGRKMSAKKRHPTIENNVIIYANTTILGGETVIGEGATIGGNIWLTESVPAGTLVLRKRPELEFSRK